MGYGKINLWGREPNDCCVIKEDGIAYVQCCGNPANIITAKIVNGHAELKVPPGCYKVWGRVWPGCCGELKETMVIVGCGGMGHRHLRGFAELERIGRNNFELVAVCDKVADNAGFMAEEASRLLRRRPVIARDFDELEDLGVKALTDIMNNRYGIDAIGTSETVDGDFSNSSAIYMICERFPFFLGFIKIDIWGSVIRVGRQTGAL